MGKILSSFGNGWAGSIARSLDDVVVALANKSGAALAFGVPVALDASGTGVVPFDPANHTGADFVGVTVRAPAKTPDSYGASAGAYAPGEVTDVLVRGHIIARIAEGDTPLGAAVSVRASDGAFAVGTGEGYVALPNVRISAAKDAGRMAELLLTERNIL